MDILCTLRLIFFEGLGSDSAWKVNPSTKVMYSIPEEWKEPIRACKLYVCVMHLRTLQIESEVVKSWLEAISVNAKRTIYQTMPKVESIWMHRILQLMALVEQSSEALTVQQRYAVFKLCADELPRIMERWKKEHPNDDKDMQAFKINAPCLQAANKGMMPPHYLNRFPYIHDRVLFTGRARL